MIHPEFLCLRTHELSGASDEIRLKFDALLDTIIARTPAGREQALVKTHLQTAYFFALAAIDAEGAKRGALEAANHERQVELEKQATFNQRESKP